MKKARIDSENDEFLNIIIFLIGREKPKYELIDFVIKKYLPNFFELEEASVQLRHSIIYSNYEKFMYLNKNLEQIEYKPSFYSSTEDTIKIYKYILDKNPFASIKKYNDDTCDTWTKNANFRQQYYFEYYKQDGHFFDFSKDMVDMFRSYEQIADPEGSANVDKWVIKFENYAKNHIWNMG